MVPIPVFIIFDGMVDQILTATTVFDGHTAAVYALANGTDDHTFISGGGDGRIVAWDPLGPENGKLIATISEAIFSIHLDTVRQMLLVGTGSGKLHAIDLRSRTETQVVELHRKGIFGILAHAPGQVVCAGGDGILSAWRWNDTTGPDGTAKLELERQVPLCEEKLRGLAISPTGDRFAVACGDGYVREFEPTLLNETMCINAHVNGSTSVSYHPDKPVLISGGKDGFLRFWHTEEGGRSIHAFAAHKGSVYAASVDPGGKVLASVGRDSLLKYWDANTLDPLFHTERNKLGHTHSINACLWMGTQLFTASDDRNIKGWTLRQ